MSSQDATMAGLYGLVWLEPRESCLAQAAIPDVRFRQLGVGWSCLAGTATKQALYTGVVGQGI